MTQTGTSKINKYHHYHIIVMVMMTDQGGDVHDHQMVNWVDKRKEEKRES